MATMYRYEFEVIGKRYFPMDMLRYDRCWPVRPNDVDRLSRNRDTGREAELVAVRLATYRDGPKKAIENVVTDGRWSSFGWYRDSRGWVEVQKVD